MLTFAVLLVGIFTRASNAQEMQRISGEITWLDTRSGKLQLEADASPRTGAVTEYRVSEHETRVTDPADNKLLSVLDLQPGQHVTIDMINGRKEMFVEKITVDPQSLSVYQNTYGEVVDINDAGTLTLAVRSSALEKAGDNFSFFVFEPGKIVVRQSPGLEPVQLRIKPGDMVRVEYVVKDGKRLAQALTLYAPRLTRTTTTTVTTTK